MKTIAQTTIPVVAKTRVIKRILKGATVRYENENESTVVIGKERTFKIEHVEKVFTAKKTGERCVIVYAVDIDDNARAKHRCLHIGGIRVIA